MSYRRNAYIPNVRFRQSPDWLLNAHRASHPYEHQAEFEQTAALEMKLITPSTTINSVRRIIPRGARWIPTALDFTNPHNSSAPKIPATEVLVRPLNRPEVFCL